MFAPFVTHAQSTVVGIVTARESGRPLPFVDVEIFRGGSLVGAVLGKADGVFRIEQSTARGLTLRVRRLGYVPSAIEVQGKANGVDTVRVSLAQLTLKLDEVRVSTMVCPNAKAGVVDTAVLAIFDQMHQNAERNAILVREFAFTATMERKVSDLTTEHGSRSEALRRRLVKQDTIDLPSEHEWRYAPGGMLVKHADGNGAIVVPQLVDFADEAFVAAHCFRYAGVETVDGRRFIRVEFEPARGVPEPDVSGSLYLAADSYRLERSVLTVDSQYSPDIQRHMIVESWFKELAPSLPVLDHLTSKTIFRTRNPRSADEWTVNPVWGEELQRVLKLTYLNARPDESREPLR